MQKGTTGTHYKAQEVRKTESVLVRMTAADMQKIKEKAELEGMSVSAFLLDAGLRRRVKKVQK